MEINVSDFPFLLQFNYRVADKEEIGIVVGLAFTR